MATILIVEDEQAIRNLLEATLVPEHQVLQASDVIEALELARRGRPNLVLLDLNLQGRHDGLKVCQALRSEPDPVLAQVPIVMLTGQTTQTDIEAALKAGADGYVRKPYSPNALLMVIDSHLKKV